MRRSAMILGVLPCFAALAYGLSLRSFTPPARSLAWPLLPVEVASEESPFTFEADGRTLARFVGMPARAAGVSPTLHTVHSFGESPTRTITDLPSGRSGRIPALRGYALVGPPMLVSTPEGADYVAVLVGGVNDEVLGIALYTAPGLALLRARALPRDATAMAGREAIVITTDDAIVSLSVPELAPSELVRARADGVAPAWLDARTFVRTEGDAIVVVDRRSGRAWRAPFEGDERVVDVSPDGSRLVLDRYGPTVVLDRDGGRSEEIEGSLRFAPDGSLVRLARGTDAPTLARLAPDGHPRWSIDVPGATHILGVADEGVLVASPHALDVYDLASGAARPALAQRGLGMDAPLTGWSDDTIAAGALRFDARDGHLIARDAVDALAPPIVVTPPDDPRVSIEEGRLRFGEGESAQSLLVNGYALLGDELLVASHRGLGLYALPSGRLRAGWSGWNVGGVQMVGARDGRAAMIIPLFEECGTGAPACEGYCGFGRVSLASSAEPPYDRDAIYATAVALSPRGEAVAILSNDGLRLVPRDLAPPAPRAW